MQDPLHNPSYEPNCNGDPPKAAIPGSGSPSSVDLTAFAAKFDAIKNGHQTMPADGQPDASADARESMTANAQEAVMNHTDRKHNQSSNADDIAVILEEVAAKRQKVIENGNVASNSDAGTESAASSAPKQSTPPSHPPVKKKKKSKSSSKKRKKKRNPFVRAISGFFPVRGDSPLEIIRKIIFLTAIVIFAACLYLILSYYIDLFIAGNKYRNLQEELGNFVSSTLPVSEDQPGTVEEYYEYNEIAEKLLSRNPDLVGYINIPGTKVSYPVVQKKSTDININTNDYYLYRAFDQTSSKSGCIFLDYRCHFDEVLDHRLAKKNSENLLIYGHNMKNETMFGSLKNYARNYSFYSEHPLITLHSLYNTYTYKIFAVFLVDGNDFTSEYAFDCWNTLDFESEDHFYEFVNNAKRRTIIANDVDVTYGDPLLTLYTCSSMISNGKLIIMAREVRPGEDPLAGTENGHLNDNIFWPKAYYRNHEETYDESLFVPYGPVQE